MIERNDIAKVEVRDRFGGGKIVDVVFTNGRKVKYDPEILRHRKQKLEEKKTSTQKEIDLVDELVTFTEGQINTQTA